MPDGEPEGVKVIDQLNWTGIGIAFPRTKWPESKRRPEFGKAGIYVLAGYRSDEDDLRTIYIGQGELIRNRIDEHYRKKEFWDEAVIFTTTNDELNKAHISWLEYALITRADKAKRSKLDNSNVPSEPNLAEAEKAAMNSFLHEVFKILPLAGIHIFEKPKPVLTSTSSIIPDSESEESTQGQLDTIVVPAKKDGFYEVFIGENCWYAIRISGGKIPQIKYIAAYQSQPISAVTHYAPVERIEPYGESGKYKLVFSEPAKEIGPIPYGDVPSGFMQGSRYTTIEKLLAAKKVTDLS